MGFRPPPFMRFSPYHGIAYDLLRPWWRLRGINERRVDSVVIPCYGEGYVEEAMLSATFASMNMHDAREILIATDQPREAFGDLPARVEIRRMDVPEGPLPKFNNIFVSRSLKIRAPLECRGPTILMIDSDLMLLRNFTVHTDDRCLLGTFRAGKMAVKVKGHEAEAAEVTGTFRPYLKTHLNSGFLVATRTLWEQLCPAWHELYIKLWTRLNSDAQPPTDQLPLAVTMDRQKIIAGNLGDWANWPVSKKIGGTVSPIPREVIGAHGGFPLSEYEKLLADRDAPLSFRDQDFTRTFRYQSQ